jgi:hypothetical protein
MCTILLSALFKLFLFVVIVFGNLFNHFSNVDLYYKVPLLKYIFILIQQRDTTECHCHYCDDDPGPPSAPMAFRPELPPLD